MTSPPQKHRAKPWAQAVGLLLAVLASPLAHSQSACNSDHQPLPTALFERFTHADCQSCWQDPATLPAPSGTLVLDWVVPASQGDNAPLAAAASTEALARLAELQIARPALHTQHRTAINGWPAASLRVAHGPASGDYMGVLITLSLPKSSALALPLSGWVLLLEAVPAGTEGTSVPRFIVKNAFQPLWDKGEQLLNQDTWRFSDVRAMSLAPGTDTRRLRVASWVQDAHGRILTAALSTCQPEDKD